MNIEVIKTKKAPQPAAAYSQAFKAGNFVFVSGQLAEDPETGDLVKAKFPESPIRVQTKRVLENIQAILKEAGTDMDHIVSCTVFLRDLKDFPVYNETFETFFKIPPPRATVNIVGLLPSEEALIEIQSIAVIP
jgi:2-iminobutanoate/2-iminopropanoate deaminase